MAYAAALTATRFDSKEAAKLLGVSRDRVTRMKRELELREQLSPALGLSIKPK
jgi:hypothetical protein